MRRRDEGMLAPRNPSRKTWVQKRLEFGCMSVDRSLCDRLDETHMGAIDMKEIRDQ